MIVSHYFLICLRCFINPVNAFTGAAPAIGPAAAAPAGPSDGAAPAIVGGVIGFGVTCGVGLTPPGLGTNRGSACAAARDGLVVVGVGSGDPEPRVVAPGIW